LQAPIATVSKVFFSQRAADAALRARKLTVVLDEWCPRFPGLCLYYPGHRQVPAGLRAFIDVLKEEARRARETSSAP